MASQQQEQTTYNNQPQPNQFSTSQQQIQPQSMMMVQQQPMMMQQPGMMMTTNYVGGCRGNTQCVAIADMIISGTELVVAIIGAVFIFVVGVSDTGFPPEMVVIQGAAMIIIVLLLLGHMAIAYRLLGASQNMNMDRSEAAARVKCWLCLNIFLLVVEFLSVYATIWAFVRCSFVCIVCQFLSELSSFAVAPMMPMGGGGMMMSTTAMPVAFNMQYHYQQQPQQFQQQQPVYYQ